MTRPARRESSESRPPPNHHIKNWLHDAESVRYATCRDVVHEATRIACVGACRRLSWVAECLRFLTERGVAKVKNSSFGMVRSLALALALGGTGAAPAYAAVCASAKDRTALETRMLQTDLVVAALSCNERSRYNAFVNRFKGEIGDGGQGLKAFFQRIYGKDSTRRLNAFVTELANEASQRTIAYQGDYCGDAVKRFDAVLQLPPRELSTFAATQDFAKLHGYESCEPAQMASTKK